MPFANRAAAMSAAMTTARLSPALLPLLRELGDLKRIRSAAQPGSIATRRFRAGWAALAAGAPPWQVMAHGVAHGLAAARLGDLDRERLTALGVAGTEVSAILERAIDAVAGPLDAAMVATLKEALATQPPPATTPPAFVDALARQPRAGVTCPGRARIMLEPAENHAEHCFVVAMYAALLAPFYDADPAEAFLAGMAHHLHSAAMPDSGFTGEMLLGAHLHAVVGTARAQAAAQLAPALAARCAALQAEIASDATPVARAFHAADAIDRVLETEQHLRRSELTMAQVLNEFELVHAGPVKAFHDRVLAEIGLI